MKDLIEKMVLEELVEVEDKEEKETIELIWVITDHSTMHKLKNKKFKKLNHWLSMKLSVNLLKILLRLEPLKELKQLEKLRA